MNWLPDILHNFLIEHRRYSFSRSFRFWSCKTTPDFQTSNNCLCSFYEMLCYLQYLTFTHLMAWAFASWWHIFVQIQDRVFSLELLGLRESCYNAGSIHLTFTGSIQWTNYQINKTLLWCHNEAFWLLFLWCHDDPVSVGTLVDKHTWWGFDVMLQKMSKLRFHGQHILKLVH